jgi:hypothetical protein
MKSRFNLSILLAGFIIMAIAKPMMVESEKSFLKESTGIEFNKKYNFRTSSVNNRPMVGVLTQPLTDA